jgi:hypothetical protein
MHLSRSRVVHELRCLYIEPKLFAFRPLPAIALAQARRAGLSVLCDSVVILKEGSCYG